MIQKTNPIHVGLVSPASIQLTHLYNISCLLVSQYRVWFVLKRESFGLRGGFHVQGR